MIIHHTKIHYKDSQFVFRVPNFEKSNFPENVYIQGSMNTVLFTIAPGIGTTDGGIVYTSPHGYILYIVPETPYTSARSLIRRSKDFVLST